MAALWAAVVVPHALYVASIGGDHFEYRPLDLYFPFAFLLIFQGLVALWSSRILRVCAAAWLLVALAALVDIPWQSHRQFPKDAKQNFPGLRPKSEEEANYLAPDRTLLHRLPGLRSLAAVHRRELRKMTSRYVGVRQEDHDHFTRQVVLPEAHQLAALVREGWIPADSHIAVGPAGAIPYFSELRALDRYGLNDDRVAQAESSGVRDLAHSRHATLEYATEIGVDLWPLDEDRIVWTLEDIELLSTLHAVREEAHVFIGAVGDERFLVARLPQGAARTKARFPRIRFFSVRDDEPANDLVLKAVAAHRRRVEAAPQNRAARAELAQALMLSDQVEPSLATYRELASSGEVDDLVRLGDACATAGRFREAIPPLEAAARRSPDYVIPFYGLGVAYWKLGDPRRAQLNLELAAAKDPIHPDTRFALGLVYLTAGRSDLALEQYEVLRRLEDHKGPELLEVLRQAQPETALFTRLGLRTPRKPRPTRATAGGARRLLRRQRSPARVP
jgi:hypothetical protein